MTTNRPEFAAHDDFIFEHKEIGKVTREEFIKYIRSSHEHMRKLSELIQQYNQTIDVYLEEWDGKFESFDDDVKDLLGRWINDGTMDHIINENLMSIKADKTYVDDLNENVTAQLAQKAEQSFVNSRLDTKRDKSVPVGLNDVDSQMLSAIEGGEGTTFELESVPRDKSVTPKKTTFITKSSNLLNRENVVKDKVVSPTGEINDSGGYHYSHRIEVTPKQVLFTRYITAVAWYDQNDNFISRGGEPNPFTTAPNNAYYARANISKNYYNSPLSYPLQISASAEEVPYEPFYELLDGIEVPADNLVGQIDRSTIGDKSVSARKTDFIKSSSNLLNREDVVEGKIISTTGEINDSDNYHYSHRIEVTPNQTLFTRYITGLAWYDQNDNFIFRENIPSNAFTAVPDNAYYVRANISKAYYIFPLFYSLQISLSDVEIPYEPYYLSIDNLEESNPSLLKFRQDERYIVEGKVDETYQTEKLDGYENVESDWLPDKIYQKFDELVSNYPSYVSKELLGRDSSGNFDINLYRFKPEQVPTVDTTKQPKIYIVAGNHGYEKTHPYVLYLVMKKLCEEWQSDESLETLRWNVEFLINPCSNPSSFETGSRENANGVDLSRNFEDGWDDSTEPNKGAYPLSEPESQYIDNVFKAHHEDIIFFTSLHNFSSSANPDATVNKPEHFIWVSTADKLQEHISQKYVSKMTRLWKKKYDWLPQDDDLYFGYVNNSMTFGLERSQANLYGISGSTYEISRIFQLEDEPVNSSSQVITMGVEGLVNLLLLNLKIGTDYYNNNKKVLKK